MSEDLKNFDDSELDEIMKEIEELEQGEEASSLSSEGLENSKNAIDQELATLNQISDISLEPSAEGADVHEVLEDDHFTVEPSSVKKTSLQKAVDADIASTITEVDNVVPMTKAGGLSNADAPVKMDFAVQGSMQMQINFDLAGQQVLIHVTEHGLEIDMHGGAKFSLPLKKAA